MHAIEPTLRPGDSGELVINLQAALQYLLDHGAWQTFDPPNSPSIRDLKSLRGALHGEQTAGAFGDATRKLLLYLQIQQGLGDQLLGIVEAATAKRLNDLLAQFGAVLEGAQWLVQGSVTTTGGTHQPGLWVAAYDRDLRRHQLLGEALTDARGAYAIRYRAEDFRGAEAASPLGPDLFVEVRPFADQAPLATSAVRYGAQPVETIDITLPASARDGGATEFERITALCQPLLVGQGAPRPFGPSATASSPADLRPDELNAEDIAFIVRETGTDTAAIEAWAESARWRLEALHRLDGDADAQPAKAVAASGWPFFYAALRERSAADLDGLLSRGSADWESLLSLGEAQRRLPVMDADPRRQFMAALALLARLARIDGHRPFPTALARVLADAPLPRAVALAALDIFDQRGLGQPDAYRVLTQDFPANNKDIERFVQALWLRLTIGRDPHMAKAISATLGDVPDPLLALSAWNLERWHDAVRQAGNAIDPLAPEVAHARAVELQLQVEQALPLPALMQRLRDQGSAVRHPVLAKLLPLLSDCGEHALSLLDGKSAYTGTAATLPAEAAAVVKNLGRYLGTGVTLQGGLALVEGGIASPGAALAYGPQVLQHLLQGLYPPQVIAGIADTLQRSSSAANGFVFNLLADWKLGNWFATLGGDAAPPQVPKDASTLSGLFGHLDACACRPCESMLSLSAYLVDLLNLLKTVPQTGTTGTLLPTAQSVLRARRPDVFVLDLGCETAQTELPHIDLANHVMARALGSAPLAQPAAAAYPWSLPFDRGWAELQPTGERLGLTRAKLLALSAAPPAADLAAATLGIAQTQTASQLSEWTLITTPRSGGDLCEAWGLPRAASVTLTDPDSGATVSGPLPTVLGRASVLLDRMGLELDALDAVLATRYVGGLALTNRSQCKASAMALPNQPEAVFDRLHRFTRLARKLPAWSVPLLDSALLACQLPSMGRQPSDYAAALQTLAAAERARLALQLAPEFVLALRMPLEHILLQPAAAATLFARDFGPLAAAIAAGERISAHLDQVAAALGCDSRTLATLVAATGLPALDQTGDLLTHANLTWLHRHVHLARALQLTVPQLVQLLLASGIDPFEASSAALTPQASFERLTALQDATARMAASPWPVEVVAQVLLPASTLAQLATRPAGLVPEQALQPAGLTAALADWQSSLRRATAEVEAAQSAPQVERLLQAWLGNEAAARVLTALVAASAEGAAGLLGLAPDAQAVALLAAATRAEYAPGNQHPLTDTTSAAALLTPNTASTSVLDARLDTLRSWIADRERDRQLEAAVQALTALPADVASHLLDTGLAVVASTGTARAARQALLADAFWKSTPADAPPPALDASARPDLHAWLCRLHTLAALVRASGQGSAWLRLTALVQPMGASAAGIRWENVIAPRQLAAGARWTPAWAAWSACVDLRALLEPPSLGLATTTQHLVAMAAGTGAPSDADLQALCSRLGGPAAELRALATLCAGSVARGALEEPATLLRLTALAQLLRGAACTAAQATQILASHANDQAAQVLRGLAEAQGGSAAALRQIADSLRMQQRDALVALLLQTRSWRDTDSILAHCLIDPLVQPCQSTTATLQAVAAVQLFVQRVLYGLEPGLSDVAELRQRWSWMRNYRVWEANRKVFLFPENLLFPELRDDKSSSFRLLESALGQGELNDERARQAFGAFLDDVVQMGQVQVLGMFDDADQGSSALSKQKRRTLYLVGRTTNPPYLYYWRKCEDFGGTGMEWSGWQRIELEIQGDHVLPYVLHGTLHVAWPLLTERQANSDWQLSFQWSRMEGSSWRRAESARVARDLAPVAFRTRESAFTFRCLVEDERVRFACYAWPVPKNALGNDPVQAAGITRSGSLDAAERSAFNMACMSGRWQYFGHVVVPLDGAPASYQVQASSPQSDGAMDAIHVITWECWIKARDSQGSGYLRIDSDPGGIANPRFLLQMSIGGSPACARQISGSLGFWVAAYPSNPFSIPEVSCQAIYATSATAAHSATLALPSVPNGEFRHTHLRMVIEPAAGQEPTLQELGASAGSSQLAPIAAFAVPAFGPSYWDDADPLPVPELHPGTSGLFNGMQGGDLNSWPLRLPSDTPEFESASVAAGISGGPTQRNYWLLPVSDQPDAARASTAWLYREGASASILDAQVSPTRFHVNGYAAAFPEAGSIRRAWQQTGSLDTSQTLPITYGADALPAPVNTVDPALWQDQVNGAFAFDLRAPYACYGWETFFHAPLLIADQLSRQQRFEEAERWLRLVFDPTSGNSSSDPKRFLKFRVFKNLNPHEDVTQQLTLLAQVAAGASSANVTSITQLIGRWRELPFRPFVVARRRQTAFLWRTVFAYLDNLLAWADSLYRRDTRESTAEATLLYVLVARILGARPKVRESGAQRPARNYDSAQSQWDDFGNLWIDASRQAGRHVGVSTRRHGNAGLPGADGLLFFCLPSNDKLHSYWDTVESRLFNIRHCRNIEGISRQQALTDPPIDPALLARATAAGLDLGQVIAGLYAPPPHYRFAVLAARATELAAEARALGSALLAAMEKRDTERLAQLRSANALALHTRMGAVRQLQVTEAEAHIAALQATRALTASRYQQYQRMLGREAGAAPVFGTTSGEESMLGRLQSGTSAASNLGLIEQEGKQITDLATAGTWSVASTLVKGAGAVSHMTSSIAFSTGLGVVAGTVLQALGSSLSVTGDMFDLVSRGWQQDAFHESLMAGHFRRRDEWAFQSNQALRELRQIDQQILANEIRIALAKKVQVIQQSRIEQAQAIDYFLHDRFCNADLYDWMVQQLSAVHFTAYHMAREWALRAQAAASRELGNAPLDDIGSGHWDTLHAGLLAGERLHQEVKRLEVTFLDRNVRLHEMTKHISLRQLDPLALTHLKRDRSCEFEVPEWLFDLDAPGHYARRLKSVSLSVPCSVDPYTVVTFKLILLGSRTRVSADGVQDTAAYLPVAGDTRFEERYGATESIVTSSGRDDSGLFETSLRDERFLPFEGAGAVSRWRLELPGAVPQFDHDSISDVLLHLRYTARDGGDGMRSSAQGQFDRASASAPMAARRPLLLVSAREDFPAAWARARDTVSDLVLPLSSSLLPYWMRRAGLQFDTLATLDMDGTAAREPATLWRRSGNPPNPAGFAFSPNTGSLSANLGTVAAGVGDRLVFLTLRP